MNALWGRGFRPFFLAASLYAALALPIWLAIWHGGLAAPAWLAPPQWHAHEMLFGVAAAAIAGFLLTASPVWAGRPPLVGWPLAALAGLWTAGRIGLLGASALPAWIVAALDLSFLPAVALAVARTLWGSGQRRNFGVVALVTGLALANAAIHAQALTLFEGGAIASAALRVTVDVVIALIVVIGGRITPSFTANALRRLGDPAEVRSPGGWTGVAVAGVLALAACDGIAPRSVAAGVAAALAALAVGVRMLGWQTARTLRDPLLWSLHAGMAWVSVGLALVAASDLGAPLAPTAGLHALTAGAIGSMILAVMTRVGLGHTGRPLALPKGGVACYALVHAGALLRVGAALSQRDSRALLFASGLLWAGAFWVFLGFYFPILTRPRVDGLEG